MADPDYDRLPEIDPDYDRSMCFFCAGYVHACSHKEPDSLGRDFLQTAHRYLLQYAKLMDELHPTVKNKNNGN